MDTICHRCGNHYENSMHALWDCEAIEFGWVNRFEASQGSFAEAWINPSKAMDSRGFCNNSMVCVLSSK